MHLWMYFIPPQQISEMLAGSLSQEDEDAVLAELEAIIQVHSSMSEQVPAYFRLICFFVFFSLPFIAWNDQISSVSKDEDFQLPEVPTEPLPAAPELKKGVNVLKRKCSITSNCQYVAPSPSL